jgi:hypothetical protein
MSEADPNADQSTPEDSEVSVTVTDADAYSQTRRLRSLHDARDQIREVRREAYERVDVGGSTWKFFQEEQRNAHVAAAVVDYLLEADPILRRVNADPDGPGKYASLYSYLQDNLNPHGDPPPIEVSLEAYHTCTVALAEHGVGVATDTDDEDTWQI